MKDIRDTYSEELSLIEDNCKIVLSSESKPDILNTQHNTLSCAIIKYDHHYCNTIYKYHERYGKQTISVDNKYIEMMPIKAEKTIYSGANYGYPATNTILSICLE